jgi:hypothetical protein
MNMGRGDIYSPRSCDAVHLTTFLAQIPGKKELL